MRGCVIFAYKFCRRWVGSVKARGSKINIDNNSCHPSSFSFWDFLEESYAPLCRSSGYIILLLLQCALEAKLAIHIRRRMGKIGFTNPARGGQPPSTVFFSPARISISIYYITLFYDIIFNYAILYIHTFCKSLWGKNC